jgi:threonine/homoserine/homoserine lactone efflux protein
VKLAGACYLVFLAWKIWRSPPKLPSEPARLEANDSPWRLFLASFSLTLGNPKAVVFFMAMLPTIVDLKAITPAAVLEIAAVMLVIMPAVLGAYALAADRARALFTSVRSIRTLNRATACVMAGAAAMIARS